MYVLLSHGNSLSNRFDGFTSTFQDKLFKGYDMEIHNQIFYTTFCSCVLSLTGKILIIIFFCHFSGCYCSNLISSVGKFGCFVAILIVESLSLLVLFGSVLSKSFGLIIRLVNQVGGDMLQCCSISILLLKSNLCSWFGFFVD